MLRAQVLIFNRIRWMRTIHCAPDFRAVFNERHWRRDAIKEIKRSKTKAKA